VQNLILDSAKNLILSFVLCITNIIFCSMWRPWRLFAEMLMLIQGSQTRGPPRVFMRPVLSSKLNKYQILLKSWDFYARNGQKLVLKANWIKKKHHIWQYIWHSEPSSINYGAQGTFSFYLQPEEHFFMLMRPLSGFEFETPVLIKTINSFKKLWAPL